jgi:hypothetical protein
MMKKDSVGRFWIEVDLHGVSLRSTPNRLIPACMTEREVDFNVKRLIDEVDRVGAAMKAKVRAKNATPLKLFE